MKRENQDFREYYQLGKKLGEGFGEVYEAIKKDTKERRAIKIIDKNLIINPFKNKLIKDPTSEELKPYIDCFYREINNMKKCEGENTVKFYEFFDTKNEFVIVMELCDLNMLSLLTKNKAGFTMEEIKEFIIQLNNAFKMMTKNKIIYRDLKLENILIKYTNEEKTKYKIKLKLGDGSTLINELRRELSSTKNKFYSNNYNAPEILQNMPYNEKCDLWSLGVILYVLLFKKYPYSGVTVDSIKESIKKNGQKNLLKTKNAKLDDLISKLLVTDPNKRLNWKEFFNHPFFINDFRDFYEIGNKIGEGGSGFIYEAKEKKTGKSRAIKIFDKYSIKEQFMQTNFRMPTDEEMKPYIDNIYNELNNMKIIQGIKKDNKNAVKIYENYENENEVVFVMELCDCNLLNFFIDKKDLFTSKKIKELLLQLNNSFKLMHENKLLHRALNLNNILLTFQNKEKTQFIAKLKLTEDSTLIKDLSKNNFNMINLTKDIKMKAPEILKNKEYGEKSDLWSLGIIIYVLYCKTYPYKNDNINEILKTMDSNNYIDAKTDNKNLDDLIKKLLTVEQNYRISWEEYFKHPFFKDMDNINESLKIRKEDYNKYYKKENNLGSGGFGTVYKAIKKDSDEKRAIKIIDKNRIKEEYLQAYLSPMSEEDMKKAFDDLSMEIKNMKIVEKNNNQNTVKFYECFETEDEFVIIMELCDENLLNYKSNNRQDFKSKEIKEFLNQLNNSFKIMNEYKIVHRDLKLENILVKKDSRNNIIFKISDYGLSKQLLTISQNIMSKVGTLKYKAPEIINNEKYSQKCDLWSLGIIIYILYFNKFPYDGNNELALLNQINSLGHKILEKTQDVYLDDLIRKLLTKEQEKRISWNDYFKHPFFTSYNKDNQNEKTIDIKNGIIIRVKIRKKNLSKDIFFFDKEHINDINGENVELYYKNKKIKFKKYFSPTEEGIYEIKILFKNKIKNCSYMFNKCNEIIYIDLSLFDTSQVTNMSYMFSECTNLENIILPNASAKTVTDMSYMFMNVLI